MSNSYLERYDAAADADKYPLVYRWLWEEPLPFCKELRAKRPILVTPVATLITRFDDVTDVLNLPKVFTVQLYWSKMENGSYLMAHDDDALHYREKSIMQCLLNRDDLPAVREMVAKSSKEILDQAHGKIDIVNAYCRMVPATLVQDYFGLTGADKKDLIEWSYWNQYNNFHNQPFDLIPAEKKQYIEDQKAKATKALTHYIGELLFKRSAAIKLDAINLMHNAQEKLQEISGMLTGNTHVPLQDDILTRMLRNQFPLAMDLDLKRLGVNAGGLLIGAIETTSQAVAQVLQYLLQHPEWLAKAQAAAQKSDLADFDAIVWEALRFVPIAPYLFRLSASDYTVGMGKPYATKIPAGTYVLPVTQSAMFDTLAFENPDDFVPNRNWYHYFHFGFGSHECLGKYVGMVMIPEMVRQVILRQHISASGAIDYKSGPFPEEYRLQWG